MGIRCEGWKDEGARGKGEKGGRGLGGVVGGLVGASIDGLTFSNYSSSIYHLDFLQTFWKT